MYELYTAKLQLRIKEGNIKAGDNGVWGCSRIQEWVFIVQIYGQQWISGEGGVRIPWTLYSVYEPRLVHNTIIYNFIVAAM